MVTQLAPLGAEPLAASKLSPMTKVPGSEEAAAAAALPE
jgi:hypothetical protein